MGEQQEGGPSLVVHRVPPLGSKKIIFWVEVSGDQGSKGVNSLDSRALGGRERGGSWRVSRGQGRADKASQQS